MITLTKEHTMLHSNLGTNELGHLTFAGADTVKLAKEYGTALIALDEARIRENMRMYTVAMNENFGSTSHPLLASKAFCCKEIYRIAASEGMYTDIVSSGELYTAKAAGFPMERAYFHGNNKTDADIELAIDFGIGYFIVDNREELCAVNTYAEKKGIRQKILLRLSPGIDPHTHAKISTGKVDSKFGTAIETGQAEELIAYALTLGNIALEGYHCHIGSQIFEIEPFCDAADIMLSFTAHIRDTLGFTAGVLNLGGGFGVRYVDSHPEINIPSCIAEIAAHIKKACTSLSVPMPSVLMEPGRSIVADAGITLYTVGSVKNITGYKSYVSVDGGMTDNPRYALYQSEYTALIANKACEPADFRCTIAGRCCESGDLLQEDTLIQKPERGDILAILVTGAYNYSMSSNYNRVPRPAVVMINGNDTRIVIKRESFEHMLALDV